MEPDLTFWQYMNIVDKTAMYPDRGQNIVYPVLGLNGEAGEVADKLKKIMRDKEGFVSDEDRFSIIKELGDVLWYINAVAYELDTTLEYIAKTNIDKLLRRLESGTIQGSGDDR